jgi:hypothetical protein
MRSFSFSVKKLITFVTAETHRSSVRQGGSSVQSRCTLLVVSLYRYQQFRVGGAGSSELGESSTSGLTCASLPLGFSAAGDPDGGAATMLVGVVWWPRAGVGAPWRCARVGAGSGTPGWLPMWARRG